MSTTSGGTEMSFIAEMIIGYYNQNCHTYSSSPLFTFTEEQIIKKVIGKKSNHRAVIFL
jgi:hypothetical protein